LAIIIRERVYAILKWPRGGTVAEKKTKVLFVGVTGWLGNLVAHALLDQGNAALSGLVRQGATTPEKSKKIADLQARGMTTATGDLSDRASLAKACEGIEVVVSAVQGGPEVIIEGQRNLLAAAEAAGVKRMIPSVFSVDLPQLDFHDNVNLDLRKTFDESFASSKVAPTSVYCGGFLDVILSPRFPLVDWEKGVMSYWGDGNQPLDYTVISDVARYTAAAVTDSALTGKPLRVAGNSLTIREMHHTLEKASGRSLETLSMGTVEDLRLLIGERKRTATNPWEWISLQYTWCMVSGKGKLRNLDNARYPQIKPISVESFVRSMLPNLLRG
jgi:nucleoside-diphosphate-sugar epimerase